MKRICSLLLCVFLLISLLAGSVSAEDAKVYRKSFGGTKKIALTFDDGPHPRLTPQILAILEEYGIKATFFVIGQNAINYPDAMKLIVESGCEVGNHTYTHRDLDKRSEEQISKEISDCGNLIKEKYSLDISLLRPPRGKYDEELQRIGGEMGYDIILWNIDTRDWEHTPAREIAKRVLGQVEGGDIILMHDYVAGKSPTCDAIRLIIPELLERGYEFVTVSELIRDEI